jgi:uncharacterized protein YjbI with pentapeptide repeats
MDKIFIEDKTFTKEDFQYKGLANSNYDNCKLIHCDFSNGDFSGLSFSECEFFGCNLSMVKLAKTAFKDVRFKNCKLLGLQFNECEDFLFSVDFDNCHLKLSSFYKLKKMKFKSSNLQEVDFVEADLSNAVFDDCDLAGAIFENTIMEKADFRKAYNYSIDPQINKIKKAKFSITGVAGLLDRYDIEIE